MILIASMAKLDTKQKQILDLLINANVNVVAYEEWRMLMAQEFE